MNGNWATTCFLRAGVWIVGLSATVLPGCATLQKLVAEAPKPTASLKDVSFKNVSLTTVTLQFDVDVSNPYDVPLPLANLDYGLNAGEARLIKGSADIQGTIPAKQSKSVSLPVNVSILDVINFARGVNTRQPIPYTADVNLGVDAPAVGRITVPMGKKGEITVPSIPGL